MRGRRGAVGKWSRVYSRMGFMVYMRGSGPSQLVRRRAYFTGGLTVVWSSSGLG